MALYKIDRKLTHIKDTPFKLEREIQQLAEENLDELLNLEFIRSEFTLNNFRIDTLAFDNESKSFVIIEYKRDKTFSVIDQGYAYLSLMLNNKADFILEYNESKSRYLKRDDVDWSQSKVIFVSPNFTSYQREAINFKDLPIELYEIKKFENNTLSFEQIQKTTAKESIKTISKADEVIEKVSKEVIVFSEQDHLQKANAEIQELYKQIKEHILSMDDNIEIQPKKQTIGFNIHKNIFCDIALLTKSLNIFLNLKKGDLQDSKNIARDISDIGHWGNGSYQIKMSDNEDINYILSLINQSLKINK